PKIHLGRWINAMNRLGFSRLFRAPLFGRCVEIVGFGFHGRNVPFGKRSGSTGETCRGIRTSFPLILTALTPRRRRLVSPRADPEGRRYAFYVGADSCQSTR